MINMPKWINSQLVTPLVGISYQQGLIPASFLPIAADRFKQSIYPNITPEVIKVTDHGGYIFEHEGYEISFLPNTIKVRYKYSLNIDHEYNIDKKQIDDPKKYTDILSDCSSMIIEATNSVAYALNSIGHGINIKKIGIMAFTEINIDSSPPGLLETFEINKDDDTIVYRELKKCLILKKNTSYIDKMHLNIDWIRNINDKKTPIYLDYQRVFESSFSGDNLKEGLENLEDVAVDMFENIAINGLGDQL